LLYNSISDFFFNYNIFKAIFSHFPADLACWTIFRPFLCFAATEIEKVCIHSYRRYFSCFIKGEWDYSLHDFPSQKNSIRYSAGISTVTWDETELFLAEAVTVTITGLLETWDNSVMVAWTEPVPEVGVTDSPSLPAATVRVIAASGAGAGDLEPTIFQAVTFNLAGLSG